MKKFLRLSCLMKGGIRLMAFVFSFMLMSSDLWAQSRRISGTVTSSDENTPIPGANILIKGTTQGATTDIEGKFTLQVDDNSVVLVVSTIGYTTEEVVVGTQSVIDVALTPDIQTLSEIVVIGYGTQKREDVTGAISSIDAATIEKIPVTSVDQALQGRAAGVQIVNNDARPGGSVSVLIRGIGSLASGGNDPLYVIDGYPTSDGINNINPNDIATIDVLKDASATSVYGVRAANGVVIITTKKGFKDKIQVSLDAFTSFQSKPRQYDLLNAQDWATLSNYVEAEQATPYQGLPLWQTPEALTTVDWQDAMYRNSLTQNYTIGIRGGTDKIQTAVSLGYYNQEGIVLGSYFKRYTTGLNLDYQATKWLKSATSVKYTYQDSNTPYGTGQLFNLVTNPPTLDGGNNFTNQIKDGEGNYGFYNPEQPNVSKFNNPVYTVETNRYESIRNFVLATSSLEATIFDGLKLKSNAGVNVRNFNGSFFQPEDARANAQYPAAIVNNAFYSQNMNNSFEWLWENTLAYDKTFGNHTVNFVAGISSQKNTYTSMGGGGIPADNTRRDLAQLLNDLELDEYGNGRSISTLASEFARLTYQFADKYMITGTIRRDGSSKFEKGNKYGIFPSGAVAWRIKNEPFLKGVGFLDDLKLRASWGRVGNQQAIDLFRYQAWFVGNFPANYNGGGKDNFGYPFNKIYQNGSAQVQPANPDLKWETNEQTDIGLDAAFLKGALTLSVDWFNRDSKDFLLTLTSSPQTGYNEITQNVGSMNNKGVELALNYSGKIGNEFQFGTGLTFSRIKNTLTSITSGTDYVFNFGGVGLVGQGWDEFSRSNVGGSVGDFFGYKSLGIFQTQEQIDALNESAPDGVYYRTATSPGDRYFADISGPDGVPDGKVDANDRTSIGSPQPKFFGGLNLDATYKGFDFNAYFYGSYGNKILNYVESHLESFQKRGSEGVQNVSQEYNNNFWKPDRPSDRYARALANDESTLNNVPSDVWVEDGSFVKLKNLTVGYTLPSAIMNRYSISRVRVYISSQNLFFITKYSGLDPEIGIQDGNATQNGLDNGTYPSSRTYTLGLNVTF